MILRDKIFYTSILGFILGVALNSFLNVGIFVSAFFVLVGGSVVLLKLILNFDNARIILLMSLLFSLGVGMFRVDIKEFFSSDNVFDEYLEKEITLEGVILEEPKAGERNTQLRLYEKETGAGILLFADSYPKFQYGDRVLVSGKLQKPENFETKTGRIFNYVSYLGKDGVYYQIFEPEIELLNSGEGNLIKRNLFKLKNSFLNSIKKTMNEPHSALLGGITVGAEESLGEELENDFRRTGIIHIVVLSGYNVTIVAEFFMRVFSFLPFVWKSLIGALSIGLFVVLTGASSTIVRAGIMAVLVIVARITGRTADMIRLLLVAGFFMVLHNPDILLYDPSFQLSFLATLGLIYLAPHIEKLLHFMPSKLELREFATATIATQIFVLPLLMYMTGEISLVSIFVNLLVLPVIPLSMFLGLVSGVFGWASVVIAFPVSYLNFILLDYVLRIVDFFSALPFASVFVGGFNIFGVLLVYLVYIFVFWRINKRVESKKPDQ